MPTLTEHVLENVDGPLRVRNAASFSSGLQNLWLAGVGFTIAATATATVAMPDKWIPLTYIGTSVSISLGTGAAIQRNKAQVLEAAYLAMESAAPVRQAAHDYTAAYQKQLKEFEKSLASKLAEEYIQPAAKPVTGPTVCPAYDLGRYPQSALIAGVPGAGKGVFYMQALQQLAIHNPSITVFIIDPKASEHEPGILKANATVWRKPLASMSPDAGASWVLDCIEKFKAHNGPKLLVIDEVASVMASMKLAGRKLKAAPSFRAFLSHITSMGDGEKHFLWMVTQDASVDGLGISSALRATLRAIAIVSPKNRQALSAFLSGGFVPLPDGGRVELEQLMEASEVGRAIFDGKVGRWLPMNRMENLTGFDRDNRKPTGMPAEVTKADNFWESQPDLEVARELDLDYFDVWSEWLQNLPEGSCTIRRAQQAAPKLVRTNAAGTKEAFAHLERMGLGTFDGKQFQVKQAVTVA